MLSSKVVRQTYEKSPSPLSFRISLSLRASPNNSPCGIIISLISSGSIIFFKNGLYIRKIVFKLWFVMQSIDIIIPTSISTE
mmetsp:Transcript_25208/g.58241  ORF Transcript_25208/g.58241 Transcript_25208/m.58241 type:complete len:82 (-) Transcript_25208:1127-1372(-)